MKQASLWQRSTLTRKSGPQVIDRLSTIDLFHPNNGGTAPGRTTSVEFSVVTVSTRSWYKYSQCYAVEYQSSSAAPSHTPTQLIITNIIIMGEAQWFQPTVRNRLEKTIVLVNFTINYGKFYNISEYIYCILVYTLLPTRPSLPRRRIQGDPERAGHEDHKQGSVRVGSLRARKLSQRYRGLLRSSLRGQRREDRGDLLGLPVERRQPDIQTLGEGRLRRLFRRLQHPLRWTGSGYDRCPWGLSSVRMNCLTVGWRVYSRDITI